MSTKSQAVRTADSVYEEIAGLTGNRAELERQRYSIIKAVRAIRAVIEDGSICLTDDDPLTRKLSDTITALEARKALLWTVIEKTDRVIQRLTDLVQNGAFDD